MNAKKKAEADAHMAAAAKYLKTSMFKWSPDHDSAGDEYSKAATNYKVSKNYDEALDALNRACDCYKECRSLYQAAKMLEQAVLICRDSNKSDQIVSYAERGGLLYRQHGSPESAATLLEKAAKIIEAKYPEEALSLYTKAADTIMTEDRPKQASEFLTRAARLLAKVKKYDEAADTIKKAILLIQESGSTGTCGRLVAALVLIQLAKEDQVAAGKVFHDWGAYCDMDQAGAIETILQGFDQEDAEAVKSGLNSGAIKNLDVEFARLAREVPVPEGSGLEAAAREYAIKKMEEMKVNPPPELPNKAPQPAKEEEEEKKEDEDDEEDLS